MGLKTPKQSKHTPRDRDIQLVFCNIGAGNAVLRIDGAAIQLFMLRKKNTRTLSELEQIPYQPQVYAIPIEQRKRESKLLADAVEFQPKLYQMIERLATAEELSDHCINIQNIEAEYMEKTVREVVTENRKTAAQMQNLVEQAGKNQEQFILNCSETLSKSTETLDSTIEKLRRKILKIMIATAVSTVVLSLLVCAVFWKLAV